MGAPRQARGNGEEPKKTEILLSEHTVDMFQS